MTEIEQNLHEANFRHLLFGIETIPCRVCGRCIAYPKEIKHITRTPTASGMWAEKVTQIEYYCPMCHDDEIRKHVDPLGQDPYQVIWQEMGHVRNT